MEPAEETHHISLLFRRMSGDNEQSLKLVEKLRKAAIAYLKDDDVIPPDADLTNDDQAAYYCFEIQRDPAYALYRSAATILSTCNRALRAGKIDRAGIDVIIGSWSGINKPQETKTVISNKSSKSGAIGGGKPKKLKGIMAAVEKILNNDPNLSAEKIWQRFKEDYNCSEKALKINGFRIYFTDTKKSEFYEQLHQSEPGKPRKSITQSAFAGYVKEAKKNYKKLASKPLT